MKREDKKVLDLTRVLDEALRRSQHYSQGYFTRRSPHELTSAANDSEFDMPPDQAITLSSQSGANCSAKDLEKISKFISLCQKNVATEKWRTAAWLLGFGAFSSPDSRCQNYHPPTAHRITGGDAARTLLLLAQLD